MSRTKTFRVFSCHSSLTLPGNIGEKQSSSLTETFRNFYSKKEGQKWALIFIRFLLELTIVI